MTKNLLEQEIDAEKELAVRNKAKTIVKAILAAIAKRRAWASAREEQIRRLELMQAEVYAAYDARDDAKLDELSRQVRGVREKYESAPEEMPEF